MRVGGRNGLEIGEPGGGERQDCGYRVGICSGCRQTDRKEWARGREVAKERDKETWKG